MSTTDQPTNITATAATLNGTLNDLQGAASLDVYFEWGVDTNYGNTTAIQTISSVPTSFSADISGLTALTTYHYRTVSTDGSSTWYGADVSFIASDLRDADKIQADFQEGTLTDVEADAGDYLRLANTDVLSFDGTDDTVKSSSSVFDTVNMEAAFSLVGWIYCNDYSGGRQGIIGKMSGANNSSYGIELGDNNNNQGLSVYIDDGFGWVWNVEPFSVGAWFHVALTYLQNGNITLYKNGAQVYQASAGSGISSTAADFTIGGEEDQNYLNGKLSDIQIWHKELTQTEIQDNMYKRLNGDETGLVAYYKLDEGTGTTATDSAGTNDGTLTNGPTWITNEPLYFMNSAEDNNRLSPQLDLFSLGIIDDTLIKWTDVQAKEIDSTSLSSQWTQTTNLNIFEKPVYTGERSVGQNSGNSIDAILAPDSLSGGIQCNTIEFYWQETTNQGGFTVQFVDSNGADVLQCGGNNPQWELSDGDGSVTPFTGDGYDRWIYYKFTFDWANGNYDYYMEDLQSGSTASGTRALSSTTDVEQIKINGNNWGDARYIWLDDFEVDGSEVNIFDKIYTDITSTTIETRVSTDGGTNWTTWTTATNDSTIPDLSSGTDVSNGLLECRQTLSTSDVTVTPELHSLSVLFVKISNTILSLPAIQSLSQISFSEINIFTDRILDVPTIKSHSKITITSIKSGHGNIICTVFPKNISSINGISKYDIFRMLSTP